MNPHSLALKINTACLFVVLVALSVCAENLSGAVSMNDGSPVPHAFVGLMSAEFDLIAHGATGTDGAFAIETSGGVTYVVVQPAAKGNDQGIGIYDTQPRVYDVAPREVRQEAGSPLKLQLPPAGCLVLKAYGPDGSIMRWEDFTRQGTFGRQFIYATGLNDQMAPAVCWPVYDEEARSQGSPREKGLPALVVEPGAVHVAQVLFWEVPDYGKLLLRADNAGEGFTLNAPGTAHVIELNVELARTAVADLERRREAYSTDGQAKIAPVRKALDRALEIQLGLLSTDPGHRSAAG